MKVDINNVYFAKKHIDVLPCPTRRTFKHVYIFCAIPKEIFLSYCLVTLLFYILRSTNGKRM